MRMADLPTDVGLSVYVTRRLRNLQGGCLLPLSALFYLSAAWQLGLLPLPGSHEPFVPGRWFGAGLLLALAAGFAIRRWYAKRLRDPFLEQRLTDLPLLSILAVVVLVLLAAQIQQAAQWPVSLPALVVGAALARVGALDYPFRRHYLAAAAIFGGLALLRALGVDRHTGSILIDLGIGTALAIAGVGDHRLLMAAYEAIEVPAHV